MTRTEKFAERLWGHLRENKGSLDSAKWVGLIVKEIEERVQASVTPLEIEIEDLKGKLEDATQKLAHERTFSKNLTTRIAVLQSETKA